jgi:hypothetical protein
MYERDIYFNDLSYTRHRRFNNVLIASDLNQGRQITEEGKKKLQLKIFFLRTITPRVVEFTGTLFILSTEAKKFP